MSFLKIGRYTLNLDDVSSFRQGPNDYVGVVFRGPNTTNVVFNDSESTTFRWFLSTLGKGMGIFDADEAYAQKAIIESNITQMQKLADQQAAQTAAPVSLPPQGPRPERPKVVQMPWREGMPPTVTIDVKPAGDGECPLE